MKMEFTKCAGKICKIRIFLNDGYKKEYASITYRRGGESVENTNYSLLW